MNLGTFNTILKSKNIKKYNILKNKENLNVN